MSELERLKEAFKAERIEPRPAAREAAVDAAMKAFDSRRASARQGMHVLLRLRNAARAATEILTGKQHMGRAHISTRHALAGGVSLAVLALAVTTAANWQTIESFGRRNVQAPGAAQPAATPSEIAVVVPPAGSEGDAERHDASDLAAAKVAEQEMAAAAPPSVGGEAAPIVQPAPSPAMRLDELGAPDVRTFAASRNAESESLNDVLASVPVPPLSEADASAGAAYDPASLAGYRDEGRDRFETIETNPLKVTAEEPVSTFSIDVDTASYSFMRASLGNGVLPQPDAVRVEELINYFPYDYPAPASADEPFATSVTVMPTPWNAETKLVHIGIRGFDLQPAARPHANLVFLIDTSGSMDEPNKLPLLINSMKLLVESLSADDTVSIVVYAGSAGTVLEPTKASEKAKILAALENLHAGGSTAGAEGIRQAYQLARQNLDANGVNRVILATDGDFNVGITDIEELQGFVEREREEGIFLSVLGFGMGNYNDELMQALAQNGNGAAAYIDTLSEARKVLVEEATSTLFPIAKDVKIQVEFNPATVSEYRLIGYETRLLNREDFNNDRVDAGEIGAGHTVTALYEVTPAGSGAELVDSLRYGETAAPTAGAASSSAPAAEEYGFLKLRYKLPHEDASRLIETPIAKANEVGPADVGVLPREARFAASVAAFGQLLRGGRYTGDFDYDDVIALANANKGEDEFGYRAEFVNLVRLAKGAAALPRQQ